MAHLVTMLVAFAVGQCWSHTIVLPQFEVKGWYGMRSVTARDAASTWNRGRQGEAHRARLHIGHGCTHRARLHIGHGCT